MKKFIPLNIQPTIDRLEKINKLLEQLIPLEQELENLGITIELKFNQTLNLSTKEDIAL
jgi:hypothetical protein